MRLTRLGLIHAFRKIRGERLGHIAHGGWCEALAIIGRHETEGRLAQAHRLFEDRVEHRGEVAGRRIDDLEDLGYRGLLDERFVTFRSGFRQLTLQCGYGAFALGAHLRTSSGRPPTADHTAMSRSFEPLLRRTWC